MGRYKVCVYAICKNEEQFVERWMASVSEADAVIVADTGSSDRTVEKLRTLGAVVFEERVEPWRFDTARNLALSHVPEDADICVSNDLDEVFTPGWREKLEAAWDSSYTRAKYFFTWSYHADGTPAKQFLMEKIHLRHGFRWVHPVHEVLEYSGDAPDKTVFVQGLVLNHYPDLLKPRAQYLPLLELSAQENPEDDRTMFWLGREYFYQQQPNQCIQTLKRHLGLPSAKWDEERSASMRFISDAYLALGNTPEARAWLYRAIGECPHVREPYLKLARLGSAENDWPLVYAMATKALGITRKSGSYLTETECWGQEPHLLKALSGKHLGLHQEENAHGEL